MISPQSQPLHVSGDLGQAVANVAADGLFAQPFLLSGAGDAVAVVISRELFALLEQALDNAGQEAQPPSRQELAEALGLQVDADGSIAVSDA